MSDDWMMDTYQELEDAANAQLEQDLLVMTPREAYALHNENLYGPMMFEIDDDYEPVARFFDPDDDAYTNEPF